MRRRKRQEPSLKYYLLVVGLLQTSSIRTLFDIQYPAGYPVCVQNFWLARYRYSNFTSRGWSPDIRDNPFYKCYVQDDQLYMSLCFLYIVKIDLSSVWVYRRSVGYTLQVNFTRCQKNTAMFIWSGFTKMILF